MSATRIYVVTDSETDAKRLVRAGSRAQAITHVSQRFGAAVATQEQLVALLDDQVLVETATTGEQS